MHWVVNELGPYYTKSTAPHRFAQVRSHCLDDQGRPRRRPGAWAADPLGSMPGCLQAQVDASNARFLAQTVRRVVYSTHPHLSALERERKVTTLLSGIARGTVAARGAMSVQSGIQNVRGGETSPWAVVGQLVSQVSTALWGEAVTRAPAQATRQCLWSHVHSQACGLPHLHSTPLFIFAEVLQLVELLVRPQRASPFTVLWFSSQLRAGFLQLPRLEHYAAVLQELPSLSTSPTTVLTAADAQAALQALPRLSPATLAAPPALDRIMEQRLLIARLVLDRREERKVKAAHARRCG